jgi:hypothetical protein
MISMYLELVAFRGNELLEYTILVPQTITPNREFLEEHGLSEINGVYSRNTCLGG